jgi:hypothetical protein
MDKINELTVVSALGVTTKWGVLKALYQVPDEQLLSVFGQVRVATKEELEHYNKIQEDASNNT